MSSLRVLRLLPVVLSPGAASPVHIAQLAKIGITPAMQYSNVSKSHGGGGVSSLRILRLLRVFRSLKLLRQVEGLNKIMNIVLKVGCTAV